MADWRFKYRYRNVPMLRLLVQAEGRPAVKLDGIVDSGATHTMLPLDTAEALGLKPTELVESPPATIADDTKVPSWFTKVPIRAQVQARLSPDDPLEPWGPIFDLYPRFMKSGSPLW
jgi:predicted aspartyl protease